MTKGNVTKVAKVIIDVADSMEVLGRSIRNCGKAVLVINETISEFIDPPKKNSVQDDLRRTKIKIKSKFMPTKVKSSKIGFKWFFMKMLMLIFIVKIFDVQIIGNGAVLRMASIFFYIFNEGISLLENVRNLRVPFLAKLKSVFEQLHDRLRENKDVYITEEEQEKCRKVIDAFAELYEIEDEDFLVVDAGRYGFVKLQCYTPSYGFEALDTYTESNNLF